MTSRFLKEAATHTFYIILCNFFHFAYHLKFCICQKEIGGALPLIYTVRIYKAVATIDKQHVSFTVVINDSIGDKSNSVQFTNI
jgi:uncharacterized protein (UPF0276 family)